MPPLSAGPPRHAAAAALAALPLVVACASASTAIPAPAPAATTTLLTRLGVDTVAVEQFTRTATHMEGTLVTRFPATRVTRYSVDVGRNGAPTRANLTLRDGAGTPLSGGLQSLSARYGRDSVTFIGHRSASDTSKSFVVRGPLLPSIPSSYALWELALARMSLLGRDSVEFAAVPISLDAGEATPQAVRVLGRDSVRIIANGGPFYVRHDGRGGIVAADGIRTRTKVMVARVDSLDLEALARAWAQRDQSGTSAGPASTRDTVEATVGAAHLSIDYGRPALRGRDVWVNGVLGDTIWRTGANDATQLRSDVELVVGGATVPAGTYTLWTAATPSGYRLVVNRQAGNVYDAKRDLVRVPLRENRVVDPVERFTIGIEPQGAGSALLTLTWGTKQLSVPVAPK
jgi:hypothetical protein